MIFSKESAVGSVIIPGDTGEFSSKATNSERDRVVWAAPRTRFHESSEHAQAQ